MSGLKQYERNITSQFGEDGVIEEIFTRIGTKNKIAVDIGANDGKYLSNTYSLGQQGWRRVLIECNPELVGEYFQNDLPVLELCTDIDSSLDRCNMPSDYDLLSLDIDGDDFYLWQDHKRYKPRVVVIEYNQTVPPHISIVQQRGGSFGASLMAICKMANEKGYRLIHTTTTNAIFIIRQEADNFRKFEDADISGLYLSDWVSYIVTGYNGKQYRIGEPAHNDNQGGQHEKLITDVKYTPI